MPIKINGEKNTALKEAFKDTWSNVELSYELEELKSYADNVNIYNFLQSNRHIFTSAQMSYLTMMAHRIYYMHKLLKDTGSFYLHCDPTMSHYLKILLDIIIFGLKNFRNEIVWCYTGPGSPGMRQFNRKHDIIFWYSKGNEWTFNGEDVRLPYKDPNQSLRKRMSPTGEFSEEDINEYRERGKIPETWWSGIAITARSKNQYLGYPTQKPEALLERIIKASSKEGDVVADFFCGCGTALTVAEKLNRKWLGVDINHLAISLVEEKRLKPLGSNYQVIGFPKDQASVEKLAKNDKHKFEEWVVEYLFKGHKTKKTGDGGIDGHIVYSMGNKKIRAVIEVKGGDIKIDQVRAFKNRITEFNADFGIFVGFKKQFTKGMYEEADRLGFIDIEGSLFHFGSVKKMYIITIEDLLEDKLPQEIKGLSVNITY